MAIRLPPPPNSSDLTSPEWRDWFYKLAAAVSAATDSTTSPGSIAAAHGTFPAALGDFLLDGDGGDSQPGPQGQRGVAGERGEPGFALDGEDGLDGMSIPGPAGPPGERGPALFLGDASVEFEEYPTPWEGIRSTEAFIGIQTENGVSDRTQSTMSFDDATRTFTVTPTGASFDLWSYGTHVIVDSARSVTIADTEGIWVIYFDQFGVLTSQLGFDPTLITQKGWISLLYWDATNNQCIMLSDERHGRIMDTQTHLYLHNTRHTVYEDGLALGDFTVDGSGDLAVHAEFSCTSGTIWDEDIELVITDGATQMLSPVAQIPVYYRTGVSGFWRRIAAGNFPLAYAQVGTRANWNEFTLGAWQLTEVTNLQFVLMHYFATNDVSTSQVIGIVGQSTYSTLSDAQDGALVELTSLIASNLPILEFLPIATVIFQTSNGYLNTPKSRIRSTATGENYIDWRGTTVSTISGSGVIWGSITGTLANQADLQAVLDTKTGFWVLPFAAAHG